MLICSLAAVPLGPSNQHDGSPGTVGLLLMTACGAGGISCGPRQQDFQTGHHRVPKSFVRLVTASSRVLESNAVRERILEVCYRPV